VRRGQAPLVGCPRLVPRSQVSARLSMDRGPVATIATALRESGISSDRASSGRSLYRRARQPQDATDASVAWQGP
jgi:hypothetical protein